MGFLRKVVLNHCFHGFSFACHSLCSSPSTCFIRLIHRRSDRVSYFLSEAAKIYRLDAGENATTKSDFVDGPEKERNHQILQNFTKAMWNVLKQYKQKLKVLIN